MKMDIYSVGGAVRDSLLGLAVQDRDYVVVGATPEQMQALGYRPVGKDFPVFLHPQTHEEYALARTERKTAPGYQGFAFHADADVTLEQDLARRDLTINAIACAQDGSLIDPFGGRADLQARIFRHVSDAFAEDPVRILRLARFAARFTGFTVAPQTEALMRAMVQAGEVDALVPERVWQELARGLMEQQPSRMFQVLHNCGALAHILPELDAVWTRSTIAAAVVDLAAQADYALEVRFAALGMSEHGEASLAAALCTRLRVPNACRDLALMSVREQAAVDAAAALPAEAIVALLMRCDAFRKPQRFIDMLNAQQCAQQYVALTPAAWPPAALLRGALHAAQTVKAGEVAGLYSHTPERIPEAIYAARVGAVVEFRDAF
jgi:tRNA nucleotidyltransferase (CCA-adding enzyme)